MQGVHAVREQLGQVQLAWMFSLQSGFPPEEKVTVAPLTLTCTLKSQRQRKQLLTTHPKPPAQAAPPWSPSDRPTTLIWEFEAVTWQESTVSPVSLQLELVMFARQVDVQLELQVQTKPNVALLACCPKIWLVAS